MLSWLWASLICFACWKLSLARLKVSFLHLRHIYSPAAAWQTCRKPCADDVFFLPCLSSTAEHTWSEHKMSNRFVGCGLEKKGQTLQGEPPSSPKRMGFLWSRLISGEAASPTSAFLLTTPPLGSEASTHLFRLVTLNYHPCTPM